MMHKEVPNILTYSRIFIIPLILFLMFFLDSYFVSKITSLLFLIASFTDFLDGFIARKFNIQSRLGRILDPIADKILVVTVLVMLVYQGKADLLPAMAIIVREVVVSGLREFLSELKVSVPVSNLSKVKTFFQMFALLLLILGNNGIEELELESFGNLVLWLSAFLTVISGYVYFRESLKYINQGSNVR